MDSNEGKAEQSVITSSEGPRRVTSPVLRSTASVDIFASDNLGMIPETAVMVQLNRQIVDENSRLAVIGEELLIPDKLEKKFKAQISKTPVYLANLDMIQVRIDQHECLLSELETRYFTSFSSGLTSEEAAIRLKRRGFNVITATASVTTSARIANYMFSGMNSLMLVAIILFAVGNYLSPDSISYWIMLPLFVFMLACTVCAYVREVPSEGAPVSFRNLSGGTASVIRDGIRGRKIPAKMLVSGDVCVLGPGDVVHADMRVLSVEEGPGLEVNERLMGKYYPVLKKVETTHKNPFDAENILFYGSKILTGNCTCLVLHCGDKTTLAKLVRQIKIGRKFVPQATLDLRFYYKAITGICLGLCLLFLIIGMWIASSPSSTADVNWSVSEQLGSTLRLVAGLVVSAVPLWFQLYILAGQRIVKTRLANFQVVVRNLNVLHTLSAVALVCTGVRTDSVEGQNLDDMGIRVLPLLTEQLEEAPPAPPGAAPLEKEGSDSEVSLSGDDSGEEKCLVAPEVLASIRIDASLKSFRSGSIVRLGNKVSVFVRGPAQVSGAELAGMTASRLSFILPTVAGFHGLSDIQKLRLVVRIKRERKRYGTSAYLAGNSVMDAPALRAAELGISVSATGVLGKVADVCMPAESLGDAILECRRGFNNLRRSMMFLLSMVTPRLFALLVSIAFNVPLPLPTLLVFVGGGLLDVLPAMALLGDPAEKDLPLRKPRNEKKDQFISQRMIVISLCFFGVANLLGGFLSYSITLSDFGFNPTGLAPLAAASFVVFEAQSDTEPGFPATTGYALDLSLEILDNVHLCGRVGGTGSLETFNAIDSIPVGERCGGDIFTLDTYNAFCYAYYPKLYYSNEMKQSVAFYENQKNIQGILFERNLTANGVPNCGQPNYDGMFIPFGYLTNDNQAIVDKAMQDQECTETTYLNTDSNLPVCFTNEALKYAQTSYFAAIQLFSLAVAVFLVRTELFSFFNAGILYSNIKVIISVIASAAALLALVYVPAVNQVINTRPVPILSFALGVLPFVPYAFAIEEIRKNMIRRNNTWGRWLMKRTMW